MLLLSPLFHSSSMSSPPVSLPLFSDFFLHAISPLPLSSPLSSLTSSSPHLPLKFLFLHVISPLTQITFSLFSSLISSSKFSLLFFLCASLSLPLSTACLVSSGSLSLSSSSQASFPMFPLSHSPSPSYLSLSLFFLLASSSMSSSCLSFFCLFYIRHLCSLPPPLFCLFLSLSLCSWVGMLLLSSALPWLLQPAMLKEEP